MSIEGENESTSPAGMTAEEFDKAIENDAELKKAIAKNKAEAVASGQARVLSDEMRAMVARAQTLRIELGGYSGLSEEIRMNQNVQKTVLPKLVEYARLRMQLTAQATADALCAELGITERRLQDLLEHNTTPTPTIGPELDELRARYDHLSARVKQLEESKLATSP